MIIIGCDFHTRSQQIAMAEETEDYETPCVDTEPYLGPVYGIWIGGSGASTN